MLDLLILWIVLVLERPFLGVERLFLEMEWGVGERQGELESLETQGQGAWGAPQQRRSWHCRIQCRSAAPRSRTGDRSCCKSPLQQQERQEQQQQERVMASE